MNHIRASLLACTAALPALYGCGGNAPYSPIIGGPNADMTLTTTASQVSVPLGQTAVIALEVKAIGAFTSPTTLSCTGLPSGSSVSFSPDATLTPTTSGSGLSMAVPTSALSTTDYPLTVTATGGGLTRTLAVTLKVTGLTVAIAPGAQDLILGQTVQYTVTVTPVNGHTGAVSLAVTGLPSGVNGSLTPDSVNLTSSSPVQAQLTLSALMPAGPASGRTAASSYPFTVTATSGPLIASADASFVLITTGGIDAVIR